PLLREIGSRSATALWPVLLLAAGGLVVGWRARRSLWPFVALWLAAALASAALGCRFFPHYFLAAAAPLALLAGLGAEGLATGVARFAARTGGGDGRRAAALAAALAVLVALALPLAQDRRLYALPPGERSHATYGPEIFP